MLSIKGAVSAKTRKRSVQKTKDILQNSAQKDHRQHGGKGQVEESSSEEPGSVLIGFKKLFMRFSCF